MGGNTLKSSIELIIKVDNHIGISLTFSTLVPSNVAMLSTLIPSNIAMLVKS